MAHGGTSDPAHEPRSAHRSAHGSVRMPQPWSARTADGLTLRGWYLPTSERRRLIVLVHGMWSSWLEMAALGRDLHHRGYDVLLFDLRGHGQSDPSRLSLGSRERADIRAVMDWAELEGFTRIGSAGSAIRWVARRCFMEAAHNPAIQVAVIDSPYGNLPELLEDAAQQAQRACRAGSIPASCWRPG